jgi:hypothetical protein
MAKYQGLNVRMISDRKSQLFEHPYLCTGNSNKVDSWQLKSDTGVFVCVCLSCRLFVLNGKMVDFGERCCIILPLSSAGK